MRSCYGGPRPAPHQLCTSSSSGPKPQGQRHRNLQSTSGPYFLFRVFYLWESFSGWHMTGLALLLTVYAVVWFLLTKAAAPQ